MKKTKDAENDAKINIERFYSNQNKLRDQRDKDTLVYGGYSHIADEIKTGSPVNIRAAL
jgi:hypothetical protein